MLENIPDGMTVQKLVYPVEVDNVRKMSSIILLGVKRRTLIHASYVYDFLQAMQPETVFV